jgi:DNA-binding transcriptional ArsR family regulator
VVVGVVVVMGVLAGYFVLQYADVRAAYADAVVGRALSVFNMAMLTYGLSAWEALGDGTRRSIFERLVERPLAVGALARDLPISRPAVSQHLRVLKGAGLVSDRAEGTRRVYTVNPVGLDALRADLDRLWTRALAAFKAAAESSNRGERERRKGKKKP